MVHLIAHAQGLESSAESNNLINQGLVCKDLRYMKSC
jgi:hypothetical protein